MATKYKYTTFGAASGRTAKLDDFLSTHDKASSLASNNYEGHGPISSRSRSSNTANRLLLSTKLDAASTRNRHVVSRDYQTSPRSQENSLNGRTSPETSEVDKVVSLLKQLKNIDVDNIKQSNESLDTELQLLKAELEKKQTDYDALKEAYDSKIRQMQELKDNEEHLHTKANRLIKEAKEKAAVDGEEKVQHLRSLLKEKEDEIRQIKSEKDSALSRLSKEMGEKLNENNSGIADLSDPNRSTKVAEKYNSLYDNDWTDALEELTNNGRMDEENGIRFLLEIMKHVYSFCTKAKQEQIENLKRLLDNPVFSTSRYDDSPSTDRTGDKQINQMLENCVKMRINATFINLQKEYSKLTSKPRYADRLPDYTNKCIEICWLMNTHNPPLVFAEPVPSGEPYNKDQYKEFTKQGDVVSFVVWLPMLIEEGGAILSKGVVQPVPSLRSEPKRGRPGSAKTKQEPRTAWMTDTSEQSRAHDRASTSDKSEPLRGYDRETYDQELKRMLRDDPSKRSYEKNFDSLREFESRETNKNYYGSQTYTKESDQQINDIFSDAHGSRPGHRYSSGYGNDLGSSPLPTNQQYTSMHSYATGLTQRKPSSTYYTDKYWTVDTASSRPNTTTAKDDRFSSKIVHEQEASDYNDTKSAKLKEEFEVNGKRYALYKGRMYVLDRNKWRLTNDLKS